MGRLQLGLFYLLAASTVTVSGQLQCQNFGTPNSAGNACSCPVGFGGADCSLPACGGDIFQGSGRQVAQVATGQLYANLSSCACEAGWGGTGCNVCTTDNACQVGFTKSGGNTAPDPAASILPGQTQNTTLTCSTKPRVYAGGQMSCKVINPTLQALFPLSSTLNIQRTLQPNLTPYPGVSATGAAGSVGASLWYDGVEQFYCQADTCSQSQTSDNGTNWDCQNLQCHCRAGSAFCGANPVADISKTINTLTGNLGIACSGSSLGSCSFKQTLLQQLFGGDGLGLSGCTFGECVRQSVIDTALTADSGSTPSCTNSESAGCASAPLESGVIAGLAVVGTLVALALGALIWGWVSQRKAKNAVVGEKDPQGGIGIEWTGVGYVVPNQGASWYSGLFGKKPVGDKVVLDNISGRVLPGQMLAVLGPSGAGKTSLVELLGGKFKVGRTSGKAVFFRGDGTPLDPRAPPPSIGFVDQSDILPPHLTVHEALLTAAHLRLPESIPSSVKASRVWSIMEQLGISHIAHTRIGSNERRGISGGEMRRVSIGLELVADPKVLFCDEPTSGLDSVSAFKVLMCLRDLARGVKEGEEGTNGGVAIIVSIHQPSSRLYRLFDNILVLAPGRSIYSGPGGLAPAEYFAARGHPCPEGYNIADHLLDLASEVPENILQELKTAQRTTSNDASASTKSVLDGTNPKNSNENPSNEKPPRAIGDVEHAQAAQVQAQGNETSLLASTSIWAASAASLRATYPTTFLTQFQVLSGREWKVLKRDHTLFLAHFALASILGIFCGGLYYQTGITIAGFQSRIGSLFFLGSLLSFTSLSALYNLVEIRPLFLRERAGGYYSPTSWLLARFTFDIIPLRIIPTIVVSTITYWMTGLAPHAVNFFKFLLILVLFALAMTLFNFLLACVFRNGGVAILLSALFNLFIMTYAGFFVHLGDIPPVLRWLQYLSVLGYCLEALSVNEVGSGLMIQDTLSGVPVNVSAQLIMELLFGFGANNYYRDVLVLFAFIAGFAISLIAVVFLFVREKR